MEFFTFINIGGTIAFAASGTLAAIRKQLDMFGIIVIAFVTSIGGGTIRDVLIGHLPVRWILDTTIIAIIVGTAIITILLRKSIEKLDKTLTFFDSLGLGFFTLRGIEAAIEQGLNMYTCIILGTITACFGGVIRDILLNEIPTLFHKEIYGTACIVGGFCYFGLIKTALPKDVIDLMVVGIIFGIRIVAVKYNVSLPTVK